MIDKEGWISTEPTQIDDGRAIIIDVPESVTESLIFGNLKGSLPYVTKSWIAPNDQEDDRIDKFRLRYNSADVLTGIQLVYTLSGESYKLETDINKRILQDNL